MMKAEKYDDEPVVFCARCYSLKVIHDDFTDSDYCMDCGSTETAETDIHTWERLYSNRYGHSFVDRKGTVHGSIYFNMDIPSLKARLYKSRYLDNIIRMMYPGFPKGLTKTDKVLMLFDKLAKDGRMDEMRFNLHNCERKDIISTLTDN